jgi:1,3-propanediol dehydrogenase
MSRPLGAIFGIPHGIANAMLLPTVLRYTMPEAEDRLATLACVVGASVASAPAERAIEFVDAVERLTRNLGIPTLGRYGLQQQEFEEALDKMAADALASGSPANNPRIPTPGEIVALYREAY